ncbi:hypothetical protein Htur_2831 [Haloterrigena turkmenica DSM 5511]|uniref:DUF7343 domain-containing protein n=1 Tax=Haloterrigena turkmenica (strain ATCC 51198 / DSM 5511 / JCM 9101 / NCIMB 13204 / VKM B-1734 / 4k) TaxID=543526 RepID=D2RXH8_HALTV|nr:transcriptional regulator [Haloterrigena turkmenica]ADB61702.1 hypothetical protein Htur_2831 [Haloterrigena turkmenica DSM 5511]
MSRRSPSTARFVRRVRRTVRASLETVTSLVRVGSRSDTADSDSTLRDDPHHSPHDRHDSTDWNRSDHHGGPDRHGRSDRDLGTDTRLESGLGPGPESPPGSKAALLDPATGPTSQSEILEHGCMPAQYVRAVLTEHGGRLKQRRFVDDYGWSPSTISELLSSLEDDGVIERYRIGREKVIRLPDEERQLAPLAGNSRENTGR